MNKEEIDSKVDFMEEILDNMDKKEVHTSEDYQALEEKYAEELSKREKLEADYQNLFQKYKDRFTESVSTNSINSNRIEEMKKPEEPKEEVVLDIRSIF